MLLNKIVINNVGVFSGRHEIDLKPKIYKETVKPIIIFGGMNGSGKTTIFDAIKLCLYGQEIFDRSNQKKYHQYLREKINSSNGSLLRGNSASVELEFEHSNFGERHTFSILRYWEKRGKAIHESLTIKRDGQVIDDVDRDNWQGFIKELIPIGLSQLFFFDGEKIQGIMNDEDNSELKRSIMTLLGLDLIERLQADMKIFKRNILKAEASSDLTSHLDEVQNEIMAVESSFEKARYELESVNQRSIEDVEEQIAKQEQRIEAQGGGYFKRKDERLAQKKQAEEKLDSLAEGIRSLASGLLPLLIAGDLSKRLGKQLESEVDTMARQSTEAAIVKYAKSLSKSITMPSSLALLKGASISNKSEFRQSLTELIQRTLIDRSDTSGATILHGLSINDSSRIIQDINYSFTELPQHLSKLAQEYEATYRTLQQIHSDLDKTPADSALNPLYEKLNELNVTLGGLLAVRAQLTENVTVIEKRLFDLTRKRDKVLTAMKEGSSKQNKVGLIERVDSALTEYYKRLSYRKIQKLQDEFTSIFLMLHRKEDLISKIEIDPETLNIFIYDQYGTKINKNRLSSGELEIYAIAMVWALARISNQALPFAVDTPLARLDSKHRDNLIQVFFPNASHQMLIFSTDTEVDSKYFEALKPYVARAYQFEYSDREKMSTVHEGYFWG